MRGFIYVGPVYAEEELDAAICPWCIADGSAARRFDATFTDPDGIGDYGHWPMVDVAVVAEVSERTPGFGGWQQERWWTHCADAAAFLGRAGASDLRGRWAGAAESVRLEAGLEGTGWSEYLDALDAEGSPTAYVFRCLHCGQLGGYSDTD